MSRRRYPLADKRAIVGVDETGIRVSRWFRGAADVEFNGRRVWSFSIDRGDGREVPWPRRMARMLDGWADVRVLRDSRELYAERLQFGSGTEQIEFVDGHGNGIILDKWGLIQRPFEGRDAGVVDALTAKAAEILEVMRRDCGIDGWISFGTLLGAARSGHAIGHDSDIDLCFLSVADTPAEMAADLWRIGRALRRAGMRVDHKSASFLTVSFMAADGVLASIDVYTTFYLDGLLHETATVRAPVAREALLPLGSIEFEGRMLPAPADPAALLEVSYGPNWRVPDPSFAHRPGPEVVDRFKGWFGALMRSRRDWNFTNTAGAEDGSRTPSAFATWVADQLAPDVRVVEVGVGSGADLRHYLDRGHPVLGLDYAIPRPLSADRPEGMSLVDLNLYDLRAVLARGAMIARSPQRQALVVRGLFEALDPDGLEAFWVLARMVMHAGGRGYFSGRSLDPDAAAALSHTEAGGGLRSFSPLSLEEQVRRAGARMVEGTGLERADRATRGGPSARWRMVVEWPGSAGNPDPPDGEEDR
jgi:hypothetical protein